ncbi:286_t:CDS:2 [Dentiscutata erythropus]|uniref:286_t:CDS:1 n=1 Tax=Dentiscutata erythropus TaxID=1348616 RepID=A0A9N9E634_9GLOM|nr:286_t:CDS:2 [Dentiscutata erythropus]
MGDGGSIALSGNSFAMYGSSKDTWKVLWTLNTEDKLCLQRMGLESERVSGD